MSKDKTGSEPNFDTVLERVNVDSKALLIKTPFDNLKIKKNLDQLYHILKKKNEDEKTVPEELRARKYVYCQIIFWIHLVSSASVNLVLNVLKSLKPWSMNNTSSIKRRKKRKRKVQVNLPLLLEKTTMWIVISKNILISCYSTWLIMLISK